MILEHIPYPSRLEYMILEHTPATMEMQGAMPYQQGQTVSSETK